MRITLLVFVILGVSAGSLAGADPEFAGEWQLDKSKCEMGSLPGTPAVAVQIRYKGPEIHWSEASDEWFFTVGGEETKNESGGKSRKVIAKWEGSALLVNSLMNDGATSFAVMDRWKISRDKKRLLIHRQIERSRGELEGDLVYERK